MITEPFVRPTRQPKYCTWERHLTMLQNEEKEIEITAQILNITLFAALDHPIILWKI